MRKERIILEHQAETPQVDGNTLQGFTLPEYLAAVCFFQPGNNAQEGAFSAAGSPQQADGFPRLDRKGHTL